MRLLTPGRQLGQLVRLRERRRGLAARLALDVRRPDELGGRAGAAPREPRGQRQARDAAGRAHARQHCDGITIVRVAPFRTNGTLRCLRTAYTA